eukprot:m.355290 g.355290  ORF g.355290 m.355290 type:complete len:214 (-) comp17213_c0_seq1:2565-3206(-)
MTSLAGATPTTLVVAHFYAEWAPQCTQVQEVLDELAKLHPNATFVRVEAEGEPETSLKFNVTAVPTVLLLKNEKIVDRVDGANIPALSTAISKADGESASASAPAAEPAKAETGDINARLKTLIGRSKVMLFMKGSPDEPRCGFSRTMVGLLKETGIEFDSFDILSDNDVRQGLKTYSNWPTYPQLYVNSELIGGLDIVKELKATGELAETLE